MVKVLFFCPKPVKRKMENLNQVNAQVELLQKIKGTLPPNVSFVDDLADLLKISNDSVYRRLRGETALTVDELALICKSYKFSFDDFLNTNAAGVINFMYEPLTNSVASYKQYLGRINEDMAKFMSAKEREIVYAAVDVPLFHHFSQRELSAFKIFYWIRSILDAEEYQDKKFRFDVVDDDILDLASSIYDSYEGISSVEIWSDDTLNTTLKQIEFYWDSGMFESKEDALLVCSQIEMVLDRLNKQAELGLKLNRAGNPVSQDVKFDLYQADVMIGNNSILVSMDGRQITYITYNTFNALATMSPVFCSETEVWNKNLIQKSNLISGVAGKQRYRFFNHNKTNLNRLVELIKGA